MEQREPSVGIMDWSILPAGFLKALAAHLPPRELRGARATCSPWSGGLSLGVASLVLHARQGANLALHTFPHLRHVTAQFSVTHPCGAPVAEQLYAHLATLATLDSLTVSEVQEFISSISSGSVPEIEFDGPAHPPLLAGADAAAPAPDRQVFAVHRLASAATGLRTLKLELVEYERCAEELAAVLAAATALRELQLLGAPAAASQLQAVARLSQLTLLSFDARALGRGGAGTLMGITYGDYPVAHIMSHLTKLEVLTIHNAQALASSWSLGWLPCLTCLQLMSERGLPGLPLLSNCPQLSALRVDLQELRTQDAATLSVLPQLQDLSIKVLGSHLTAGAAHGIGTWTRLDQLSLDVAFALPLRQLAGLTRLQALTVRQLGRRSGERITCLSTLTGLTSFKCHTGFPFAGGEVGSLLVAWSALRQLSWTGVAALSRDALLHLAGASALTALTLHHVHMDAMAPPALPVLRLDLLPPAITTLGCRALRLQAGSSEVGSGSLATSSTGSSSARAPDAAAGLVGAGTLPPLHRLQLYDCELAGSAARFLTALTRLELFTCSLALDDLAEVLAGASGLTHLALSEGRQEAEPGRRSSPPSVQAGCDPRGRCAQASGGSPPDAPSGTGGGSEAAMQAQPAAPLAPAPAPDGPTLAEPTTLAGVLTSALFVSCGGLVDLSVVLNRQAVPATLVAAVAGLAGLTRLNASSAAGWAAPEALTCLTALRTTLRQLELDDVPRHVCEQLLAALPGCQVAIYML